MLKFKKKIENFKNIVVRVVHIFIKYECFVLTGHVQLVDKNWSQPGDEGNSIKEFITSTGKYFPNLSSF